MSKNILINNQVRDYYQGQTGDKKEAPSAIVDEASKIIIEMNESFKTQNQVLIRKSIFLIFQ